MTACAPIVIVAHTNMSLVQGVKILRGNKGSELQHTKQGLQGQKFKKHNYLEGLGWPPNFSPSVPSLSHKYTFDRGDLQPAAGGGGENLYATNGLLESESEKHT